MQSWGRHATDDADFEITVPHVNRMAPGRAGVPQC